MSSKKIIVGGLVIAAIGVASWLYFEKKIEVDKQTSDAAANADLNADGKVDVTDLGILLSAWGANPPTASPADINQSGTVDVTDLGILLSQWGTVSGTTQPTVTFTASSLAITSGQSSTLTWSTTNISSNTCTASGGWSGSKPLSGTQSVSPTQTTTYTLTCNDTPGTVGPITKSITISVGTSGGHSTTHEANLVKSRTDYAADPRINCSKYPEKRIFLETQAWWMSNDTIKFPSSIPSVQTPEAQGTGGHAHTATCFPADQKISGGKLQFDVRLMLHKGNEAQVDWLDIGVGPGGESVARVTFNPKISCPGGRDIAVNCTFWVPIELDTSKVPSGYQELRFRFNLNHPSGDRQFASTGWEAWYHGGTSTYRTPPWQEARGWWPDTEYANARMRSAVPVGTTVSGTYTFNFESVPGAGGTTITQHGVFVDAFFNLDDFGQIVTEGTGEKKGSVSIDTRQLSNGLHWIAILSAQRTSDGTNTGIFQFPIIVQN